MRMRPLLLLLAGIVTANAQSASAAPAAAPEEDPYLWLEDVEGTKALDWVRAQNAVSQRVLESDSNFARLQADILAILDSDARIPFVEKIGGHYYNFWRDKQNPQGLWRRTTLEQYRAADPQWEVLIDLDALGRAEGVNWVWGGAQCLRPEYDRCLIDLSRGGADASVTREFSIQARKFLDDGFSRPEAKGWMSWKDADTAYVSTDFGAGSMTESGYPRLAKLWRRGTPLAAAQLVYEGRPQDMAVGAQRDDTPGYERDFVVRSLAFYSQELYWRKPAGELVKIDAPDSAQKSVVRDWLLLELREPYALPSKSFPAGSLIAARFDDFIAGQRDFQVLFEPSETTSLASFAATKNHLLLNILDNVKNRIEVLTFRAGAWSREPLRGAPATGALGIAAVDDEESDDYFLTATDFLTPTTLSLGRVGEAAAPLKRLPAFFDATNLEIRQRFVASKDGTKVPYFLVHERGLQPTGDHPILLYGYGGFEVSETPRYSGVIGRAWLEAGGVYALANIRGGGEFGPRWHQAALKANRLRAYEDFAAVARDLIDSKLTSAKRLGIEGASNGGLLMGNMLTHYPELFGAVVCEVPLLDMKRYHELLAGASWMAEYGDPDKPEEWAFIRAFSPYQNVRAGVRYPPVLFTTSTRDDRVHPGHARKMMARMKEQGHDVLYYENIEGGHGGAANNAQAAKLIALEFTFLKQRLFPLERKPIPTP